MARWTTTAFSGLVAVWSLGAMMAPAQAFEAATQPLVYPPPPGMALTDGRPTNALMLHARYNVDPIFLKQLVPCPSAERAGTIVIDTGHKFLYLITERGWALRYGIGTAKTGFEWSGVHQITRKAEWPTWTPPPEMIARRPDIPHFMTGGINNPLGARALYIGDTLYRVHGTNEPWTIGGDVSSGCIRMTNDDVTDLYARVRIGGKVVVL
jgi:lipoprotein-anchoring transpeptidase ErfK/SrfK